MREAAATRQELPELRHRPLAKVRWTVSLVAFLKEDGGQDLVEHSLLLALICTASAALFMGQDQSIKTIWDLVKGNLQQAAGNAS